MQILHHVLDFGVQDFRSDLDLSGCANFFIEVFLASLHLL